MRHAAPKAHKGLGAKSLTNSLFASRTGSHSAQGVRAKQAAAGDAQALAIDEDLAAKLNEVAPLTRKAIRQTAKAAQRKHNILTSVSLATLVGTAATSMAFMKGEGSTVLAAEDPTETTQVHRIADGSASRSDTREALDSATASSETATATSEVSSSSAKVNVTIDNGKTVSTTNAGKWGLGGDNSIAAIGTFFLDHIFTKDKFSIETKASAKFGYNRIKAVPEGEEGEVGIWYKNQDEFWVQTAPSFNFSKNWSYGAMLKFRTQFANGYKARTQQKEIHRKSTFMSPGYLDLSVGLTYNCPNKSFPVKINMSPVALSAVFVESKQIRENFVYDFSEANKEAGTRKYVEPYGVPSNKTSKYEGGSSIQIDFDRKFGNRDVLRYRTTFFSFYGWISNLGQKNKIAKFSDYIAAYDKWEADGKDQETKPTLPIHPTVRWENTLDIKATKYLTTSIYFQLYYNRAQSYAVQTQAILSVGLSYTFQNKPKPKK